MSKKGGAALQKDAPWRVGAARPIPRIHHSPVLRVSQTPHTNYACSVMKDPDPLGNGLATGAIVEAAGPECIVPGQMTPIRLLGVKDSQLGDADSQLLREEMMIHQVWPVDVDLKFLEPVGKELKLLGKFLDDAVNLMNKSFIDR